MDLQTIETMIKKIPELIDTIKTQGEHLRSLEQIITELSCEEAMNSIQVQKYTGYSLIRVREIMNKTGASKQDGKLWVRKSDLISYLTQNRMMSEGELLSRSVKYSADKRKEQLYAE